MNMPAIQEIDSSYLSAKLNPSLLKGNNEFPHVIDEPFVYKKLDDGYNVIFHNTIFGVNQTPRYVTGDQYLSLGFGFTTASHMNLQKVSKVHEGYREALEECDRRGMTTVDLVKFMYRLNDTDKLTDEERENVHIFNVDNNTKVTRYDVPKKEIFYFEQIGYSKNEYHIVIFEKGNVDTVELIVIARDESLAIQTLQSIRI